MAKGTPSAERSHTLYRAYNKHGHLLYVGISVRPDTRFSQHRMSSTWWREVTRIDIEHCRDKLSAIEAEKRAVLQEDPIFNEIHTALHSITGAMTMVERRAYRREMIQAARARAEARMLGISRQRVREIVSGVRES